MARRYRPMNRSKARNALRLQRPLIAARRSMHQRALQRWQQSAAVLYRSSTGRRVHDSVQRLRIQDAHMALLDLDDAFLGKLREGAAHRFQL